VTTTSPLPAHVGTVLADRYELVRHIARGGMGDVYEATDRLLSRPVAVKVFRAAPRSDRDRFDAEVRTLAGLNHPVLVRVYDAGSHDDDAFVVLELIDGPPLSECLRDRGPMSSADVANLAAELADGLAYIHERGVVHRDVTPANVLCAPDGRPRLVDFGIARLLESPRVTATAVTIGTAAYMAPEQVQGHDVTAAADVYALGLVLLEALTGRREYSGTIHEVVAARLARDPDTTTGVPEAWRGLLAHMTSRDPVVRPSAMEVRDRALAMGADDSATAPLPIVTAPLVVPDPTGPVTQPIASGPPTMPFPVPPSVPPAGAAPARPRAGLVAQRAVLLGIAAVVALFVLIAAARSGGGGGAGADLLDSQPTTTTVVRNGDARSTTASTTPATTATTQAPVVSEPNRLDPMSPDFDPFAGEPPGRAKKAAKGQDG
jgi:serine/threonine protein kinase